MENSENDITSISKYLQRVEELSKGQKVIWFRGQEQITDWELQPTLQRNKLIEEEIKLVCPRFLVQYEC